MKLQEHKYFPRYKNIPGQHVPEGEIRTFVGNLKDYNNDFKGFKTIGVACCFAVIAVYIFPNKTHHPIAMSHFVAGSSDDDIDDAQLNIEEHFDDILKRIEMSVKNYDEDNIYFIALGGQESSKNYYKAMRIISEIKEYNIHNSDIHFKLAPSENDAIDVACDKNTIHFQKVTDEKIQLFQAAENLCYLYSTLYSRDKQQRPLESSNKSKMVAVPIADEEMSISSYRRNKARLRIKSSPFSPPA